MTDLPPEPPPSPDDYRIVPAHVWDVFALRRLEGQVFTHDAYTWPEMLLLLLLPRLVNLKLVGPDGELAGFVSGGQIMRGKTWIITLGIHPAYRRRGLGRRLLRACEA
ncbi:MAG: GNAT family N-acetyltransferase, partial [Anaerolineae bacterium]|nr:GNAT family N-acetyltransferase [Anaerolineae bacterium]